MGGTERVQLTTFGGKMIGEKGAVMSFSLEVLLAAMLGGGREGDKLVHYRLLMFMYLLTIS